MLREGTRSGHRYRRRLPCQDQSQRRLRHRERSGAAEPAVRRRTMSARERPGHGADRTPLHNSDRNRRTSGGAYGVRELVEMGVVDIMQTDINHVGGITALWKVGADGWRCPVSRWRRTPAKDPSADSPQFTWTQRPQLPGAGNLQRRSAADEGKGLGGMDGIPCMRMVKGSSRCPKSRDSDSRSMRRLWRNIPSAGQAHGESFPRGRLSCRVVAYQRLRTVSAKSSECSGDCSVPVPPSWRTSSGLLIMLSRGCHHCTS